MVNVGAVVGRERAWRHERWVKRVDTTRRELQLEIGREGVRRAEPEGMALSFLAPDGPFDKDVITKFCHHIHFFASPEAAESWVRARPGHLVLSLEEGVELARRRNQRQYGDLLRADAGACAASM